MSDPFQRNNQAQLMREASIGLVAIVILLAVFVYLVFLKLDHGGSELVEQTRDIPIATQVWPNDRSEKSTQPFDNPAVFKPREIASFDEETLRGLRQKLEELEGVIKSTADRVASPSMAPHSASHLPESRPQGTLARNEFQAKPFETKPFKPKPFDAQPSFPVTRLEEVASNLLPPSIEIPTVEEPETRITPAKSLATSPALFKPTESVNNGLNNEFQNNDFEINGEPNRELKNNDFSSVPIATNALRSNTGVGEISGNGFSDQVEAKIKAASFDDNSFATQSSHATEPNPPLDPVEANVIESVEPSQEMVLLSTVPQSSGLRGKLNPFRSGAPVQSQAIKVEVSDDFTPTAGSPSIPPTRHIANVDSGSAFKPLKPTQLQTQVQTQVQTQLQTQAPSRIRESAPLRQAYDTEPSQTPRYENPFPSSSRPGTQTTREGDSYWTIAERAYEDGRLFRALYEHNRPRIGEQTELVIGTVVETPSESELRARWPEFCPRKEAETVNERQNEKLESRFYVTKANDTLFEIARDHLDQASRYVDILKMNENRLPSGLTSTSPLDAGIKLMMPLTR